MSQITGGRILRRPEVREFSGKADTQIDDAMKRGEFPRPIKLSDSGRSVGWLMSELIAWRDARVAKRDATLPPSLAAKPTGKPGAKRRVSTRDAKRRRRK